MRPHLTLFAGIFCVMALSNAIVPVLPAFGAGASVHGLIFAAYFFGAFLVTIPAGILSDRYGHLPVIRFSLLLTVASGLFFLTAVGLPLVLFARILEGIGAGCFVTAALSYVNSDSDHVRMSSWYMASMNTGLLTGLLITGWLASDLGIPASGILLFSVFAVIPCGAAFLVPEPERPRVPFDRSTLKGFAADYCWLWYSTIVLIGITGLVAALYPKFSGAAPAELGLWAASMNAATVAAVLVFPQFRFLPVASIRWAAVLMGMGVIIAFFTPAGFLVLGAVAGVVMIAQLALLAGITDHQGVAMGVYASTSYLGMALLPAIGGYVADDFGFSASFLLAVLFALSVAITIGRCSCIIPEKSGRFRNRTEREQ